ncbi:ribonuclease H-like domain-containing protein [Candidatus Campbellbacteria bacterium]|nr:MAG: ribonuclease H-like domain-containing protein [Candidatus Campbellbacteria bacterium]
MKKVVFDIETRNIFDDVGKNDPALLDISIVGVYDYETDTYTSYAQEEFPALWALLERADVLIGFNSDHFDIPLLNKYFPGELTALKSIDIMTSIKDALGRRLSLNNVAGATLGLKKSADGLQAYQWWKEGRVQEIRDYCLQDVKVTKDLYEHIVAHKKIKYRDGQDLKELTLDTSEWDKGGDHALTYSLGF